MMEDETRHSFTKELNGKLRDSFNTHNIELPGSKQRKKSWDCIESQFESDGFAFTVRDLGDRTLEPFVILAGGPGSSHSDDYKTILAPRNEKRALMFNPRCVDDNQHISVNLADNEEWKHESFIKSLALNTLENQVADIEKARLLCAPDKKVVLRGDSWGTTVALAYAQTYPENVSAMILNLPFLCTKDDFELRRGSNGFHAKANPAEYADYLSAIGETIDTVPADNPNFIAQKYMEAFASKDMQVRNNAFRAWMQWEQVCDGDKSAIPEHTYTNTNKQRKALVMAHYHAHNAFVGDDGVLTAPDKIKDIPVYIIANSQDPLVAPGTIFTLLTNLPNAEITDVPRLRHSRATEHDAESILIQEMGAVRAITAKVPVMN